MDRKNTDLAECFVQRLAVAARAEDAPAVDVAARVLNTVRLRRREAPPVWDWSFGVVALASCAVALFTVVTSADAFGFLFDPLVALLSVYPDIQF
jgi:hypothetical protein